MEEKTKVSKKPEKAEEKPVAPAATEIPATPVVAETVKKPKSKKTLFIVIVIVLILAIGGAAGAYFGYVKPNQPANVVKSALNKTLVATAGAQSSFDITAQFTPVGEDSAVSISEFTVSGGFDADSNMQANVSVSVSGFDVSAQAILRLKDQEAYLKLEGLDSVLSAFGGLLSDSGISYLVDTLSNNWVRLSASDLEDAGIITSEQTNNANECIDALATFVTDSIGNLQTEFGNIYKRADFAKITKVGSDVVDGKKLTKYAVNIDQTKFKVFLQGLGNTLTGSAGELANKCGMEITNGNGESSGSSDSALSSTNMDIQNIFLWVSPEKLISKIEATVANDEMETVITATLGNDKVDTNVPSDYLTIPELLQDQTFTESFINIFSGFSTLSDSSSDYSDSTDYSGYSDYTDYLDSLTDL